MLASQNGLDEAESKDFPGLMLDVQSSVQEINSEEVPRAVHLQSSALLPRIRSC